MISVFCGAKREPERQVDERQNLVHLREGLHLGPHWPPTLFQLMPQFFLPAKGAVLPRIFKRCPDPFERQKLSEKER